MEKKLQKVNTDNVAESIRQKVTNYRQLKQQDKVSTMGTLIKDRCEFFLKQDERLVEALRKILASTELDERSRYEALLKEFADNSLTQWQSKTEKLEGTELYKFELEIDYEKFTCVLIGSEQGLWKEVLKYFEDMLREPKLCTEIPKYVFEPVDLLYIK